MQSDKQTPSSQVQPRTVDPVAREEEPPPPQQTFRRPPPIQSVNNRMSLLVQSMREMARELNDNADAIERHWGAR